MEPSAKLVHELQEELDDLRSKLSEAKETLRAIRSGEVDALVVSTGAGDRVFTLQSADYSYRVLVESMNEGAVILAEDGVILYSNSRFARMIGAPLQKVIGAGFYQFVAEPDLEKFFSLSQQGRQGVSKGEISLETGDGAGLLVSISISLLQLETPISCMIVTDLTESKIALQILQTEKQRLSELSQVEHQQRLFAEGLTQSALALTSSLKMDVVFDHILEQINKVIPFDVANISLMDCDSFQIVRVLSQDQFKAFPDFLGSRFQIANFPIDLKILETRQTIFVNDTKNEPGFVFLEGRDWVRQYIGTPLISNDETVGFLSLFSDAPGKINPDHINLLGAFASQAALAIRNARLYENLQNSLQQEQVLRAQMIQTEKFAAIGRMVASITHELNNPLQSIKNCLYLTREELGDNNEHPFLGLAMQEVQRLSDLVGQLRDVYRPRPSNQADWIDLVELLAQVKALVAYEMQSSNVIWQQDALDGEFGTHGANDQLKQVFLN